MRMRCDRAVLAAAVLLCGASAADELVFTSGAVLTGICVGRFRGRWREW